MLSIMACAADVPGGPSVEEAWARPAGEGANGVAYLAITNTDSLAVRLDSVTSAQALAAELHETVLSDGMARMTPLTGVDIPARGRLQMEPGGAHVMLIELQRPMSPGDSLPLRLHFSNGTMLDTYVQVRSP
jgi:copper(I)-binding protein